MTSTLSQSEVSPNDPQGRERIRPEITVARIDSSHRDFGKAQQIEYEVFLESGYVDTDSDHRLKDYDDYDADSIFVVAYGPDGEMWGVLREIRNPLDSTVAEQNHGHTGFKTLDDFDLYPQAQEVIDDWKLSEIVEAGTAAVPKEYRHSDAALQLYHSLYKSATEEGKKYCVASIDSQVLRAYRMRKIFNFEDIGETLVDYIGSPTTPVALDLRELGNYLKENDNEAYYRKVILGEF